jgi:23S rRNA (uracil1939-C5)-methyltransferase
MKPGAELTLQVAALEEHGAGAAALEAAEVYVAGALPGEIVRAVVEHVSPHRQAGRRRLWARLDRVIQPAPDRVAPACPAYGACGGCPLQHMSYPSQVAWKGGRIAAAAQEHLGLRPELLDACVPSPSWLGYRSQGKYVYGRRDDGRLALGAYAPRSHRLVDLVGCRLVEPGIDETARRVRELLDLHVVAPYDERRRTGRLRYVVVRANALGRHLVTLVTVTREFPEGRALAAELQAAGAVAGVVQNVNPTTGNVIFGDQELTLAGEDRIEEEIEGARVLLSSRAFFQVNRGVAALAYRSIRAAAERLGAGISVVDAYAGVGGIALALAPLAREVAAIEANPAATAAGALAARRDGLAHVRFLSADAAQGLSAIRAADLVVLNPPRAGCAEAALAEVARLRPRLVAYLSCNPDTLVRDLLFLARRGLVVQRLTPFDMLPHTPHVETLALLGPGPVPGHGESH